jgi:hypothetical protein
MSEQPVEAVAAETSAAVAPEETEELETLHNPNNLLRMVTFAKVLSWIMLILVLAVYGMRLYSEIQQITAAGMTIQEILTIEGVAWMTTYLQNFALGFFYFVVLQGVAEGLNILADIFDTSL